MLIRLLDYDKKERKKGRERDLYLNAYAGDPVWPQYGHSCKLVSAHSAQKSLPHLSHITCGSPFTPVSQFTQRPCIDLPSSIPLHASPQLIR